MNTKITQKVELNFQEIAKRVLLEESSAINKTISLIDANFTEAVEIILQTSGKLVVTGIGKSAIIAQKIVATMNSTGQPAAFMHAADAIHGDLGMIQPQDVILCLSKSGNTPEVKALVPLLKRVGNKLIALVSNPASYLGQQADITLHAFTETEACPLNLAPTTSTTVSLALGDALAICLLEARSFSSKDFAKYHPGGSLGKKLYLKVADIYSNHALPVVLENANIQEVILEMTSKRLGATAVNNDTGFLVGIITDGDLRRMLNLHPKDFNELTAKQIMTTNPKSISPDAYAAAAILIMQEKNITQLVVVENNKAIGFIHLHDLLKEGLV